MAAAPRTELLGSSLEEVPEVLGEAAGALDERKEVLDARIEEAWAGLTKGSQDLKDLRIAVATLKIKMAMNRLPLAEAAELLRGYSLEKQKIEAAIADHRQSIEDLQGFKAKETAALETLEAQVKTLREARAWPQSISAPFESYRQASLAARQTADLLIDVLQESLVVLEARTEVVEQIASPLQVLEASWKAELLTRQAQIPVREQLAQALEASLELPEQAWRELRDMGRSGRLLRSLQDRLFPIVGLIVFLVLLNRAAVWVKRSIFPFLQSLESRARTLSTQSLLLITRILASSIFLISFVPWLILVLNVVEARHSTIGRMILGATVATVIAILLLRAVRGLFGQKRKPGLLPLESDLAKLYRRHSLLLGSYAIVGAFSLFSAQLLKLPDPFLIMFRHYFNLGILVLSLWLLRPVSLNHLIFQLTAEGQRPPRTAQILRAVGLVLLAAILITDLLAFRSLSIYLSDRAVRTEAVICLFLLLSFAWKESVHLALSSERGTGEDRQRMVPGRLGSVLEGIVALLLGVLGGLIILWIWGLGPDSLVGFFKALTMRFDFGPIQVTALNLVIAGLILYLIGWFSNFSRSFLHMSVFPRTGVDPSVQYTITTIMQYVIIFFGIILVMNVLGFSMTNLAIVTGALGVGVGLGLQDLVKNFVSGLVLLIERPIRTGDRLMIDGQLGEVIQIRMRSTIFQTSGGSVLIIPNSELISRRIQNLTLYGRGTNLVSFRVDVPYNADVREVARILVETCAANQRVLEDPPPRVSFEAYEGSTLSLSVAVFIKRHDDRVRVTRELNAALIDALRVEGIGTGRHPEGPRIIGSSDGARVRVSNAANQ